MARQIKKCEERVFSAAIIWLEALPSSRQLPPDSQPDGQGFYAGHAF